MAKEKTLTQADLKLLRHTVFTSDEEARIERKKNKPKYRPYKISVVWDAEKQKYIKVKRYKKSTKMNKKELEAFYGHKWGQPTKIVTLNTSPTIHAKNPAVHRTTTKTATTVNMYGLKMVWDDATLRYKVAA